MHHLLEILTEPDNIAIVVMLVVITAHLVLWWRQAREHDRLLGAGGEAAVLEEMKR